MMMLLPRQVNTEASDQDKKRIHGVLSRNPETQARSQFPRLRLAVLALALLAGAGHAAHEDEKTLPADNGDIQELVFRTYVYPQDDIGREKYEGQWCQGEPHDGAHDLREFKKRTRVRVKSGKWKDREGTITKHLPGRGKWGIQLHAMMDGDQFKLDKNGKPMKKIKIAASTASLEHIGANYLKDDVCPHGRGTMTWMSGRTYEGQWRQGERHGRGKMTYSENSTLEAYEGQWRQGKRHGRGKLTWKSGETYDGEWQNGHLHGRGTKTYPENDKRERYEGQWCQGKRRGRGKLTWKDGETYDGEWLEGLRHGRGTETYPKNEEYGRNTYDGPWLHGRRDTSCPQHIATAIEKANKALFPPEIASLIASYLSCPGKLTWRDGQTYDGEWKGKRHGRGIHTYAKSSGFAMYVGDYYEGQHHGTGTVTWKNGDKYEGEWRNGQNAGRGLYTHGPESNGPPPAWYTQAVAAGTIQPILDPDNDIMLAKIRKDCARDLRDQRSREPARSHGQRRCSIM